MPRSIHIVAGLAARDGGPAYSVPRLCASLRAQGDDAQILTVRSNDTPSRADSTEFPQDAAGIPLLRSLRLSSALAKTARRQAASTDIFHSHGLWLMPNVYAGHAAAKAGKTLVVSPRGMLAPAALEFSKLKKRLFWRLLQGPAYSRAALWHATAETEADEIRAFGIKAPVAVIPNGIDLPERLARHDPDRPRRTLLFLSRLHPKKGLDRLIAAWARVAAQHLEWDLAIAGDSEGGHRDELEAQVAALGTERITFAGPVYGEAKARLLEGADLFVLPTLNENFGIAVAEALASGIPAVVTKGAPWAGLESERCGWWIDHGVEHLAAALSSAMALPSGERAEMGRRGRDWMARSFGWDAIAAQMAASYRWLGGSGPRPDYVILD